MDLFNLAAKLSLDSKGFTDGLKKANKQGENFAKKLTKSFNAVQKVAKAVFTGFIAKQVIGTISSLANATATFGDRIDKSAQRLGLSYKAYQQWDWILRQNGGSIDGLNMSMKTLNSHIDELSDPQKREEATKLFQSIGVDPDLLLSLDAENRFDYIINAFQQLPDGVDKTTKAYELFGKGADDLIPTLNQSSEELYALKDRASELGLYMSDEGVKQSVAYGDALDEMKATFTSLKNAIVVDILPYLTDALKQITEWAASIKKAYEENGLQGVFDKLVGDITGIPWPTWDDVAYAIETGWNSILRGIEGLAKISYKLLVDIGIPLPEWDEVASAIKAGWDKITSAVNSLLKITFGTKVDGSIDFPSWDEIAQKIKDGWKLVVDAFSELVTIVFGDKVDGEVELPNLTKLKEAASDLWNDLVDWVADLGGLIFGRDTNGDVNWPKLSDLYKAADDLWKDLCTYVGRFVGLVFGADDIESVASTFRAIGDAIKYVGVAIGGFMVAKKIKDLSETVKTILSFKAGKLSGWTKFELIMAGIAAAALLIYDNWDKIQDGVDWLSDKLDGIDVVLGEIAKNVFTQIIDFLTNPETYKKIVGVIVSIVKGVKDALTENIVEPILEDLDTESGKKNVGKKIIATAALATGYISNKEAESYGGDKEAVEAARKEFSKENGIFGINKGTFSAIGAGIQKTWEDVKDVAIVGAAVLDTTFTKAGDLIGSGLEWAAEKTDEAAAALASAIAAAATSVWNAIGGGGGGGGGNPYLGYGAEENAHPYVRPHAKGLWYVPYDGYVAELHRGERIQTASQARHDNGGGASAGDIAAAVKAAVSEAMANLSITLDKKIVGKVMGDTVSSRVHDNINFANAQTAYSHGR